MQFRIFGGVFGIFGAIALICYGGLVALVVFLTLCALGAAAKKR